MVSVNNGMQVYSAGLDNNITVWDLRKGAESMTLKGHTDSITGLALDPDGTHLLSNAADNSLRVWDLRPYAPANRCEKIFTGHQHNYERNLLRCSWSSDGSKVCWCSSAALMHKSVSTLCQFRNLLIDLHLVQTVSQGNCPIIDCVVCVSLFSFHCDVGSSLSL